MRTLLFIVPLFLAGTASASTINYTLTAGTDTIAFSLPQLPTPLSSCAFSYSCFSLSPVTIIVDGVTATNGEVNFYTPANLGGLTILEGSTLLVNNNGPGSEQLFTGTLTSPTLETFTNLQLLATSFDSPQLNEAFLLNATSSSSTVPEPESFAFVAIGIALLGGIAPWRRVCTQ